MTLHPKKMAARFLISASTLRNYEAKGLIPPAERSANGYRIYTDQHATYLACIQAMAPAFGMEVTTEVLRCLKRDKLNDALWIVREKEASLYEEKERLEKLIQDMQQYASENQAPGEEEWFNISEVSKRTRVPKSAIRYWEKAGLLIADRDPANDYRRYGASHLLKIKLIRVLRSSVYSEDTVNLKQSIAAIEQTNLQHVMKIAANALTYLNKINESQIRGIYYLYKLIRLTKAAYLDESKPWEDKLSP